MTSPDESLPEQDAELTEELPQHVDSPETHESGSVGETPNPQINTAETATAPEDVTLAGEEPLEAPSEPSPEPAAQSQEEAAGPELEDPSGAAKDSETRPSDVAAKPPSSKKKKGRKGTKGGGSQAAAPSKVPPAPKSTSSKASSTKATSGSKMKSKKSKGEHKSDTKSKLKHESSHSSTIPDDVITVATAGADETIEQAPPNAEEVIPEEGCSIDTPNDPAPLSGSGSCAQSGECEVPVTEENTEAASLTPLVSESPEPQSQSADAEQVPAEAIISSAPEPISDVPGENNDKNEQDAMGEDNESAQDATSSDNLHAESTATGGQISGGGLDDTGSPEKPSSDEPNEVSEPPDLEITVNAVAEPPPDGAEECDLVEIDSATAVSGPTETTTSMDAEPIKAECLNAQAALPAVAPNETAEEAEEHHEAIGNSANSSEQVEKVAELNDDSQQDHHDATEVTGQTVPPSAEIEAGGNRPVDDVKDVTTATHGAHPLESNEQASEGGEQIESMAGTTENGNATDEKDVPEDAGLPRTPPATEDTNATEHPIARADNDGNNAEDGVIVASVLPHIEEPGNAESSSSVDNAETNSPQAPDSEQLDIPSQECNDCDSVRLETTVNDSSLLSIAVTENTPESLGEQNAGVSSDETSNMANGQTSGVPLTEASEAPCGEGSETAAEIAPRTSHEESYDAPTGETLGDPVDDAHENIAPETEEANLEKSSDSSSGPEKAAEVSEATTVSSNVHHETAALATLESQDALPELSLEQHSVTAPDTLPLEDNIKEVVILEDGSSIQPAEPKPEPGLPANDCRDCDATSMQAVNEAAANGNEEREQFSTPLTDISTLEEPSEQALQVDLADTNAEAEIDDLEVTHDIQAVIIAEDDIAKDGNAPTINAPASGDMTGASITAAAVIGAVGVPESSASEKRRRRRTRGSGSERERRRSKSSSSKSANVNTSKANYDHSRKRRPRRISSHRGSYEDETQQLKQQTSPRQASFRAPKNDQVKHSRQDRGEAPRPSNRRLSSGVLSSFFSRPKLLGGVKAESDPKIKVFSSAEASQKRPEIHKSHTSSMESRSQQHTRKASYDSKEQARRVRVNERPRREGGNQAEETSAVDTAVESESAVLKESEVRTVRVHARRKERERDRAESEEVAQAKRARRGERKSRDKAEDSERHKRYYNHDRPSGDRPQVERTAEELPRSPKETGERHRQERHGQRRRLEPHAPIPEKNVVGKAFGGLKRIFVG